MRKVCFDGGCMCVCWQDAHEVVELMKESLFDTFADDTGVVDFSRSTGSSKAKELKKLKALLYKVADEECNNLFKHDDIFDIATSNGIPGNMVEELIQSLNNVDQCLLKKPHRTWQLTGGAFPPVPSRPLHEHRLPLPDLRWRSSRLGALRCSLLRFPVQVRVRSGPLRRQSAAGGVGAPRTERVAIIRVESRRCTDHTCIILSLFVLNTMSQG